MRSRDLVGTMLCAVIAATAGTGVFAAQDAPKPPAAVDPALAAARVAYLRLEDESALAKAREILARKPDDLPARELEVRALLQMKRPREAVAAIAKAKEPPPSLRLLEADALGASGDGDAALVVVEAVLVERPRLLEAHLAKVRALIAKRDIDAASAALETMRQRDPSRPDFFPLAAALLEQARRYPEALQVQQAMLADPKRFEKLDPHVMRDASEGIARIQFLTGRFGEAMRGYGDLAKRWPRIAEYQYRLGLCQGMAKLPLDSIASLRAALELDPELHECRMRLAEMYRTKQMVPEAIAEFEKLRAVPSLKRDAARALADLWLKSGELDRAAELAKEFEGLEPPTAPELEVAGLIHEKRGEPDVARQLYRRCLELDALQFDVSYRLALLLMRSEQEAEREEGAARMARYERLVPVLPDLEGAVAAFKLTPSNPAASVGIAGILNVGGDYELARTWVERALKLAPEDPLAHGIAGCIAANQHRDADALASFERSRALAGAGADPKLEGYIEALRAGKPLPLPLGEIVRSAAAPKKE